MIAFQIDDMTCGHCASTITRALKDADPSANVRIDLTRHRVEIEGGRSDAAALRDVIVQAGYSPVPA